MKTKLRATVILAVVLILTGIARADIIELDLFSIGCPTEFDSNSPYWKSDFDLGIEFTEISSVYIDWSGTITAEKVCSCGDPDISWPIDGKFIVRLNNSNSDYDISNAYVYAGEASYPNDEPFSVRSQLPLLNYAPGELFVRFADGTLTSAERNVILASYGGGILTHSYRLVPGLSLVELPQNVTVQEAITVLSNAPEILYAEPNYIIYGIFIFTPQYWHALLDGKGSIEISLGKTYRSLDLCTVEYPIGRIDSATLVIEGVIPEPATFLLMAIGIVVACASKSIFKNC